MQHALERVLAAELAAREGLSIEVAELQLASEEFRAARNLLTPEHTERWLLDNALDVARFSELVHDNLLTAQLGPTIACAVREELPNALRALGLYEEVQRLARSRCPAIRSGTC